jgi:integrase
VNRLASNSIHALDAFETDSKRNLDRFEPVSTHNLTRFESDSNPIRIGADPTRHILAATEQHGGSPQLGGWQDLTRRRYQNGNIRKRGKRCPVWELQWWADYLKPDGSIGRKRESLILGRAHEVSRRQAQKLAAEHLRPLNQGKLLPSATITFEDFIERYFYPNALPTLKQSTRKRYRSTITFHLIPAFGPQRLCDISTLQLQSFVLGKMDSGSGWEVCNHLRNLMSKIFASAKKWGHFAGDNPAGGVDLPEKIPVREKHALSAEQSQQLFMILPEPVRTVAMVGILAGLRIGEILGLRWENVNFASRTLRIEHAVYRGVLGTPKTKGSRRTLPMPEALIRAMEGHSYRSEDRSGLVFATRTGKPYSDTNLLARVLRPAGVKIGAPWLSWHTLRRTHATLLSESGASPKDAQAQLGHAHISTTMDIYTQPTPQHQRDAVDRLSQLVTNGDELAIWKADVALATTQIQ